MRARLACGTGSVERCPDYRTHTRRSPRSLARAAATVCNRKFDTRVGTTTGEWNNVILALAGSPDLTRAPERQYDRPVLSLGLLTASCPSGGCFLMNVHQIDAGRVIPSRLHAMPAWMM